MKFRDGHLVTKSVDQVRVAVRCTPQTQPQHCSPAPMAHIRGANRQALKLMHKTDISYEKMLQVLPLFDLSPRCFMMSCEQELRCPSVSVISKQVVNTFKAVWQ